MYRNKKIILIIVAAGSGSRMETKLPKQFMAISSLSGRSLLQATITNCVKAKYIDEVIVVTAKEYMDLAKRQVADIQVALKTDDRANQPVFKMIPGGKTRQESVKNGVESILITKNTLILVHDGARPYATNKLFDKMIEAAYEKGAAVPYIPVKETIRDLVSGTLKRENLVRIQTPQAFRGELLKRAIDFAEESCFVATDDGSLVENLGEEVALVLGEEANIKITTKEDVKMEFRVGTGYDVHRLVEGRELILAGVNIPYEKGLFGHSDADVLTHALMDAILGAMGEGDIGRYFPDSDEKYRGISSIELLGHVKGIMEDKGFFVVNGDITVICQKPKILPFVSEMKRNIESVLGCMDSINIKGTTTEKLGFEGRGEGIAANAIILLRR
ncbi:2-C-methyl-D-erythritol 4-phosphate cytidylyltransferase [Eubacteriales bacterium KG127]